MSRVPRCYSLNCFPDNFLVNGLIQQYVCFHRNTCRVKKVFIHNWPKYSEVHLINRNVFRRYVINLLLKCRLLRQAETYFIISSAIIQFTHVPMWFVLLFLYILSTVTYEYVIHIQVFFIILTNNSSESSYFFKVMVNGHIQTETTKFRTYNQLNLSKRNTSDLILLSVKINLS